MKPVPPPWLRPWLASAAIALAVVCVYWPGLGGGFVFDDMPNIVHNTELHVDSLEPHAWLTATFSSPASRLARPLAMLTLAANHFFTGLDPWPIKATNVAIHVLNFLLVFGLVRALLRVHAPETSDRRGLAFAGFVAGAWALHPINLMAVLLAIQRMESLSHTFVFAGLWLYLVGRRRQIDGIPGGTWRALAGLLGGTSLGLLSKESAVLLPLYAFIVDAVVLRFAAHDAGTARGLRRTYVFVLLLPALAAIALVLPITFGEGAYASRSFNLYERLLTEARVVLDYLRWCLVPSLDELSLYHDDYVISRGWLSPPATLLAAITLGGVAMAAWLVRRRRPLVALGVFWFFAAHTLTATIIPLELMFEHRNYFASLGICLALGDLLLSASGRAAWLRAGAALALLLFYGGLTHLRAREWDHPVRFVATEVAKHPQSPRATYELARMLVVLSDYRSDSPYVEPAFKAIEAARAAPGSTTLPAQAALIFAARTGKPLREEWWRDFEFKLRNQPLGAQSIGSIAAMVDCANPGICRFPQRDMLRIFGAALAQGDNPEVLNLFGSYALNSLGDMPLGLALWREATRIHPIEPQYHINLARLLIELDREDEARAEIAALRRIGRLRQNETAARMLEEALRKRALERQSSVHPGEPAGPISQALPR